MSDLQLSFEQLNDFDTDLSNAQMYFIVSHKDENGRYQSCKIDFNHLAIQLNNSISSMKSAAYHQSSDFATKMHDHDIYTSAVYDNGIHGSNTLSVMNMRTNSMSYTMSISAVKSSEMPDVDLKTLASLPKLGTLQLISVKDLALNAKKFDYRNEMFTGWISAGASTTYNLADFVLSSDISNVFNSTSTQFTIPCLTSFFKINDDSATSNPYSVKNGATYTPIHTHGIDNSNNSQILLNSSKIEVDNSKVNNILNNRLVSGCRMPRFYIYNNSSEFSISGDSTSYFHHGLNNGNNFRLFLDNTTSIKD